MKAKGKVWRPTKRDMQRAIRIYKNETGKAEVDMHDVAQFAIDYLKWPAPVPQNPIDMLASKFSDAAREEIRHDKVTGRPYRANHVVYNDKEGQTIPLWIDLDEERRRPMIVRSLNRRLSAMIDDGVQLSFDAEHWNRINPDQEPVAVSFDLHEQVEWRKNSLDHEDQAG